MREVWLAPLGIYMNGLYPWVGWSPPPAKKCPVVLAKALDKQSKWAEGMSEKNERDIETSKGATSGPKAHSQFLAQALAPGPPDMVYPALSNP